jgi:hypothetical protein
MTHTSYLVLDKQMPDVSLFGGHLIKRGTVYVTLSSFLVLDMQKVCPAIVWRSPVTFIPSMYFTFTFLHILEIGKRIQFNSNPRETK